MLFQMAAGMSDRQRQVQSKVDMKVIPALWTMPKFVGDWWLMHVFCKQDLVSSLYAVMAFNVHIQPQESNHAI
jgi:hypothetical protein